MTKSQKTDDHAPSENWCSKGKHYVHRAYFGKNRYTKDGLHYVCSICRRFPSSTRINSRSESLTRIFNSNEFVVPKIEWQKLLNTKLIDKSVRMGEDIY